MDKQIEKATMPTRKWLMGRWGNHYEIFWLINKNLWNFSSLKESQYLINLVGEHSSNPKISPTQSRGLWYSTSRVSILSLSTRLRINSSYGFNSVLKWKLLSVCSGSLGCEVVPGKVDVDMYCEPSRMFEAWSYISGKICRRWDFRNICTCFANLSPVVNSN